MERESEEENPLTSPFKVCSKIMGEAPFPDYPFYSDPERVTINFNSYKDLHCSGVEELNENLENQNNNVYLNKQQVEDIKKWDEELLRKEILSGYPLIEHLANFNKDKDCDQYGWYPLHNPENK